VAFEAIRARQGAPRVSCICDECLRSEIVAAPHVRRGSDSDDQAAAKVQRLGWSFIGKRLRCPACEARRKVVKVNTGKRKAVVPAQPPRAPTKAQKREIIELLHDVYDAGKECYRRNDTDETVASVLEVMPGWVTALRKEFFGDGGGNEEMTALAGDLESFLTSAKAAQSDCEQKAQALAAEIARAEQLRKRLAGIEGAVGPRLLSRVK
tara:strand:- start:16524 stop:17150 length:627 start_codon:yes stop_codon:yes gene_type:complete